MGFIQKALSAFIEFDARPVRPPASPERIAHEGQEPRAQNAFVPGVQRRMGWVDPDQIAKFEQHFDKLFEESNLPGPDYFEFQKAMDALESDVPTEDARMRVAFKTLTVQGLTKAKLVDTARQYVRIVEGDRAALEAEVDAKTKAEIEPLETTMRQAEAEVKEDEAAIKRLQDGLTQKRAAVEYAYSALASAKERLGANIQGYQMACKAMVSRIEQDITKIESTL